MRVHANTSVSNFLAHTLSVSSLCLSVSVSVSVSMLIHSIVKNKGPHLIKSLSPPPIPPQSIRSIINALTASLIPVKTGKRKKGKKEEIVIESSRLECVCVRVRGGGGGFIHVQ